MNTNVALLELARARCSVRRYAPRPVARDAIDRCLEAARLAPSACNSQPWTFLVADRDPARTALAQAAFGGLYAMNAFAREAPVLIAVVAESSKPAAAAAGWLRRVPYNLIDIGIAGEHLVLQAAAEGIGTCWLGWFDERAVKKIVGLPRRSQVPVLISLGYPAESPATASARKPLEAVRRYLV
jgi:nitroreductase